MIASHIVVEEVGILWEGGINSGRVEYSLHVEKGGIFWEGGINSGSVTYKCSKGIRFWGRREGYIIRASYVDV